MSLRGGFRQGGGIEAKTQTSKASRNTVCHSCSLHQMFRLGKVLLNLAPPYIVDKQSFAF